MRRIAIIAGESSGDQLGAALIDSLRTINPEFEIIGMAGPKMIAAGCRPCLPRRLAYPEVLDLDGEPANDQFFYDGTPSSLAAALTDLAAAKSQAAASNAVATPLPRLPGLMKKQVTDQTGWSSTARRMRDFSILGNSARGETEIQPAGMSSR